MRTTIRLADEFYEAVREHASQEGKTVPASIEEALRAPIPVALEQMQRLRDEPGVQVVRPGPSFWTVFTSLCAAVEAQGNLVSDAAHAALAIEHRATFVTLDRDFARFPDLRWESPLATGQAPS